MKKIVLLSCVGQKLSRPAPAADLYTSPWFRKALRYARSLHPDEIYILSAKHGLVALDEEVAPYELTLNTMAAREVRAWAARVLKQLSGVAELRRDRFIFLAGNNYRKYLVPHIAHSEVPMEGLRIGEQLQFLSKRGGRDE